MLHRATVLAWFDSEGSQAASIEGITLSQRVDHPLVRASAQGHALYWQLHRHGARVADVGTAEEIVAAARIAGDRELLAQSTVVLILLQLARSHMRAAAQTAMEGIENPRATSVAHNVPVGRTRCGSIPLQLGDGARPCPPFDGVEPGAQIPRHLTICKEQVAALHPEFAFAVLPASARRAVAGEWPIRSSSAMVELDHALLGLGKARRAYATFTAPHLQARRRTAMPRFWQLGCVKGWRGLAWHAQPRPRSQRARHFGPGRDADANRGRGPMLRACWRSRPAGRAASQPRSTRERWPPRACGCR